MSSTAVGIDQWLVRRGDDDFLHPFSDRTRTRLAPKPGPVLAELGRSCFTTASIIPLCQFRGRPESPQSCARFLTHPPWPRQGASFTQASTALSLPNLYGSACSVPRAQEAIGPPSPPDFQLHDRPFFAPGPSKGRFGEGEAE